MDVPLTHLALSHLDGRASEEVTDLRWSPLTPVMHLLSNWWIKGPLFVAVVLVAELVARRGLLRPVAAAGVTLGAVLAGSAASSVVKLVIDRPRPPLAGVGISSLGPLPSTSSFPSGHATTAFAAASAVAVLRPALRRWVLVLAAAVAVSRVYLGMHYVGDVLAGAALGRCVGAALAYGARARLPRWLPPRAVL